MRIGQEHNFLSIEEVPLDGGYSTFHFEAVASAPARKFAATHDRAMMDTSAETAGRFADFASFKSDKVEIPLTEGGWLRLERNARGYITLCYRIGSSNTFTALEGTVIVEGEYAGSFCREFEKFFNCGEMKLSVR
jgi:hypothetical protein